MEEKELRFRFGKNWRSFAENALSEKSVERSVAAMKRLLGADSLSGKTFLDIGCGSGLSSLAACRMGAARVTAFDYDQDSVDTSLMLRDRAGISAGQWAISRGSVLDSAFMANLEPSDVVYSWGVLHHTGAMWDAIKCSASKVKPGGLFAIAIYNKVAGRESSELWWRIKRAYNKSSPPVRQLIIGAYIGYFYLRMIKNRRNPFAFVKNYRLNNERGMDFKHDIRDWVGGFPYEYATTEEIVEFVKNKCGMEPVYSNPIDGHGCNEFAFRAPA